MSGISKHARACCAAALALSFLGAGCTGSGDDEAADQSTEDLTVRRGVDYSFARPSPAGLKAAGYTFAARYLSYAVGTGKNLSAAEAKALQAAGVDVVSNWEYDSTAALNGFSQGVADARAAKSQAAAAGSPPGRPIYFSVDFDATPAEQVPINAYFDGVISVIGVERTGAYGGYYVVKRLFDAGKIKWGWQTAAWSAGQWDPRAQVRQVQFDVTIAGGACDVDDAVAEDFGQWEHPTPVDGSFDNASCTTIAGWAWDPNKKTTSSPVEISYGGALGAAGTTHRRYIASANRPDLVAAIGSANHGFAVRPPRSLFDGQPHALGAYGVSMSGGPTLQLAHSPKTFKCPEVVLGKTVVKRHVTTPTVFAGWRFDAFTDVAPETAAALAAVPDGPVIDAAPDALIDPASKVWIIDEGERRLVRNAVSVAAWRLAPKKAPTALVTAYPQGPDWPSAPELVRGGPSAAVYVVDVPASTPPEAPAASNLPRPDTPETAETPETPEATDGPGGDGAAPAAPAEASDAGGGCAVHGGRTGTDDAWLVGLVAALTAVFERRRRRRRR